MNVPHIRVVKAAATRGVLASGRNTRFYLTLPGEEEKEITAMRSATLTTSYDGPDEVQITMLATIQIEYASEACATCGALRGSVEWTPVCHAVGDLIGHEGGDA